MPTATLTPPDADEDQNPIQNDYDRAFNSLTSPEHMAKDGTPGEPGGAPTQKDEKSGFWNGKDRDNSRDTSGQSPSALGAAESNPAQSLFNASDAAGAGGGFRRWLAALAGTLFGSKNRTKTILGGGSIAGIIIAIAMGTTGIASLEIVHIRENMLGQGSSLMNKALQNRFHKNMGKILTDLAKGDSRDRLVKNLDRTKMETKFRAAGFDIDFDKDSGKLTRLAYNGSELDLSPGTKNAYENWIGKGDLGAEIKGKIESIGGLKPQNWKGVAASKLWDTLGVPFKNWLKPPNPEDKNKNGEPLTDGETFNQDIRTAQADVESPSAASAATQQQTETDEQTQKDAQGTADPKTNPALKTGADLSVSGADEARNNLLNNLDSDGSVDSGSVIKDGDITESAIKDFLSDPSKVLGELPASAATAVEKSVSILGYQQIACSTWGHIKFVSAIKNIALDYQLARFALLFLTAADNQKAGVVSSAGIQLLATYLNTANPKDGKSAVNSGGLRNLFGDKTAVASSEDLGKLAVGRGSSGVFSVIKDFVDHFPGVNPSSCKFVNNKVVSFGALAVGLFVAFWSGGASAAANSLKMLPLFIAYNITLELSTQILIRSATGILLTGLENGEFVGDALASANGSLTSMLGQADGVRPATKSQVAALSTEVAQDQKYALAHESIFDRYFSLSNTNSLASDITLQFAPELMSARTTVSSIVTGIPHMFGSAFSLLNPFGAKVSAATDPSAGCQTDPVISKYDLATDQFCHPIMANAPDLDPNQTEAIMAQNNLIDESDNPVANSDYAKWIADCATGRASLGYTDPTLNESAYKNGEIGDIDNSGVDGTNPCIEAGPPLQGETATYPGTNQLVGMYDRFSDMYGLTVDEDNFGQYINGDFSSSSSSGSSSSIGATGWPFAPGTPITIEQCFTWNNATKTGHPGLDMSTSEGAPIYAITSGTVHIHNTLPGNYGPFYVTIDPDTPNGTGSGYGHMDSATVTDGQHIQVGQQVGTEGNQGDSQGAHLHLNIFPGAYSGHDYPNVDPWPYLKIPSSGLNNAASCS